MRCPVPLLAAAWWLVALPQAVTAQPAPSVPAQTVPPEAAEDKGQLPSGEPGVPAGPVEGADREVTVLPGDAIEEPAAAVESAESRTISMTAEQNELRARIEAIQRGEPLDDSVQRPLDFARAALERSRASHAVGDGASETRTQKLARAAVELAEARLRLLRERSLFLAARARHEGSSAELAVAQRALERERARARELERASAAP
jgi:hypothetical protein